MKSYQIGNYRIELFNTDYCEDGLYVYSLYRSSNNVLNRIGTIRISNDLKINEVKLFNKDFIPYEIINIAKEFMEVLINEKQTINE